MKIDKIGEKVALGCLDVFQKGITIENNPPKLELEIFGIIY